MTIIVKLLYVISRKKRFFSNGLTRIQTLARKAKKKIVYFSKYIKSFLYLEQIKKEYQLVKCKLTIRQFIFIKIIN